MNKNYISTNIFFLGLFTLLFSQTVYAAKFKCWTNSDGIKECGSYVPLEYSQQRIETRNESGRVIDIQERAKTKKELVEIQRLAKIKKTEDEKIAAQNKKDIILLKTFSTVEGILILRDNKIEVIEGIITVTKGNNVSLNKKLKKLQKRAANFERRGNKPPKNVLADIKKKESRINKNNKLIALKRAVQNKIRNKAEKDTNRFRVLKNIKKLPTSASATKKTP